MLSRMCSASRNEIDVMARSNPEAQIAKDGVSKLVEQIAGKKCVSQQVGSDRSLFLGFGNPCVENGVLGTFTHWEWEIGTYGGAWRVMRASRVICGSQEPIDSIGNLRLALNSIEWGGFRGIHELNEFDIRVELDNGVSVDFLTTYGYQDELIHAFFPHKVAITYSCRNGWNVSRSDQPAAD